MTELPFCPSRFFFRKDPPPWNGSTKDFSKKVILVHQQTQEQELQLDEDIKQEETSNGSKKSKLQRSTKKQKATDVQQQKQYGSSNGNTSNKKYHRTYPITPYGIWVSEIMLQQTRVEAVIEYWIKWMNLFPTIEALANATEDDVNTAWVGLGYYRRARFLHSAAKEIMNNPSKYNGTLPESVDELIKLPGIGKYTASAIGSIAFNQQVPVVDGNVCRILSRLRCMAQHTKAPVLTNKYGWILAQQIVDATSLDDNSSKDPQELSSVGDVNQAIMELGATYCSPAGSGIDINDPLREHYWSTKLSEIIYKTDPTDLSNMIVAIEATRNNSRNNNSTCPVCNPDGIMDVVANLSEMNSVLQSGTTGPKASSKRIDIARANGHAVFPCPTPKLNPRKEALVVATISCTLPDSEKAWLLVKRPSHGLLAGQWEFPSVLVWSSVDGNVMNTSCVDNDESKQVSNQKSHKKISKSKSNSGISKIRLDDEIPELSTKDQRHAIQRLVKELVPSVKDITKAKMSDAWILSPLAKDIEGSSECFTPVHDHYIEHIFSHVRHSMWIMSYHTNNNHPFHTKPSSKKKSISNIDFLPEQWSDSNNRVVRWMRQSEIKSVGVTSGIGKIFKALQQKREDNTSKISQTKKRTR
jgi:A/G-specific adenine glycosylase